MSITDGLRKAFDDCTVMAGVEDKFECVYITKAAATKLLDEVDEAIATTLGNDGLERSNDGVDVTCVPDDYTAKLMVELTRVLEERDTLNAKFEVSQSMRNAEYEQYTKENARLRAQLAEWKRVAESKQDIIDHMRDANAENARLRERITTQKQTVQAYRDESREWREVAERAQAENAKLREQLDTAEHNRKRNFREYARLCHENDRLRELVTRMARVLNVGGDWCERDCGAEFGCTDSCPIADAMREMGIEEVRDD